MYNLYVFPVIFINFFIENLIFVSVCAWHLFMSYPIIKEHLCLGDGDLLCPDENPRIYVYTVCTGNNVREICTEGAAGYILYVQVIRGSCCMRCACTLRVLCGYNISIYYTQKIYGKSCSLRAVCMGKCGYYTIFIYYIYNIIYTSCTLK